MLEVKSVTFRRGTNTTIVDFLDAETDKYLNFTAVLPGDLRSENNSTLLEKGKGYLANRLDPTSYLGKIEGKILLFDEKLEEVDALTKRLKEQLAEVEKLNLNNIEPEKGAEESIDEGLDLGDIDGLDLGDLNAVNLDLEGEL